ncbi:MAG: D-glycero-beta-D-manno-heptose 1-phosphate adenylyltransferase [Acidobacteria bacterium]|nr:MAG: D-glycero-beta-D-manno-heptose 1-phosphate adenylyltransferase [Acidobacteriota bacterium]
MRDPRDKILPRERLARLVRSGAAGPVALANGLFDLVHVGHARYLADARARCGLLVVALNDDASAEALRGPGRPIVPLPGRLLVVAAFRAVDYVTWFPERTAAATLRLLRPRFHVKGTDYRPGTLPEEERRAHEELGIEVLIAGDPKRHATTDLIRTILARTPPSGAR